MVFDIDDAIWEPPAHVSSPFLGLVDFGWVRKMAGMCTHAVVGNAYLADYVRQYDPNITIIPTCIDMDKHVPKEHGDVSGSVVLGWTGLKDNLGYLAHIEPVLQELARKHDLKMLVTTGRDYHLDGVEVENEYWVNAREIDYLRRADIGLMPLEDTPRARGKCAFKALQYMAVGVPPIVSPVGMNAEVIEDGVDGYLATTPEEWREKLERLIVDAELRRRMGAAAREKVHTLYSHDANFPKLRAVVERVGGMRR
jgi:glycosyltransferase involved in cell wall biosynthesis